MKTDYVSCTKDTPNKYSSVRRTKQDRKILVSNYVFCGKEKSRFIKNEKSSRLELHLVVS